MMLWVLLPALSPEKPLCSRQASAAEEALPLLRRLDAMEMDVAVLRQTGHEVIAGHAGPKYVVAQLVKFCKAYPSSRSTMTDDARLYCDDLGFGPLCVLFV